MHLLFKSESGLIDESCWTDVEFIRSRSVYIVTKTLAEKAALDLAEELGLDLVSVIPTWITGPFICAHCPDSVYVSMALILGTFLILLLMLNNVDIIALIIAVLSVPLTIIYIFLSTRAGDKGHYQHLKDSSLVHVDDVARAHIHLLEHPEAKGRYICSAVEFTIEELCEFISPRYPEHQMPTPDSWKDIIPVKFSGFSTKKLQEIGFKYENGLEETFDGAIKCCKEKGLL
ncbi:UNVERIFIED_CONTAM: Dihydroflavonol 4-reductase [Sesamum radiatum]|uniref:Dihydroflavonol 4-reductase n=1 Tax=Sesamum radiatum TaxID=300843 RepID=A0AAW2VAF8_SESRA